MSANILPSSFSWGDIALSQVVFVDGVPHATRYAIGEWLEYEDPQEGIRKLLNRNPHIEAHGIPVNLTGIVREREYETTVYHPIGFLLIVMESGQPKAHAMKAAVAEFVWRYAGGQKLSHKERIEKQKLCHQLALNIGASKDAFARKYLLAMLQDLSLEIGQPLPDIALIGKDPKQLALEGL